MKTFKSMDAFVNKFAAIDFQEEQALDEVATKGLKNVKARHGVYPTDVNWAGLKAETIKRKRNGDTPLKETGELMNSYKKRKARLAAAVESSNIKAVFSEFGTVKTPARPVARPEAIKSKEYSKDIMQKHIDKIIKTKL